MSFLARAPRGARAVLAGLAAVLVTFAATRASAFDPFEIQVYDGQASGPGEAGLELHANHVAKGLRTVAPPELAPHRRTNLTLEPSLGLMPWWELGAYLQSSLGSDGTLDWAGYKLRTKFVTPPKWHPHLRLGVNFELGQIPSRFSADTWNSEVRPILAWENDDWHFAVNPNVATSLGGCADAADCRSPELEPAAMALEKFEGLLSIGFEYYGSLGRIKKPLPISQQTHYVFAALNVLALEGWELNVGVGRGLTEQSNTYIVKTILGHAIGGLLW